MFKGQTVGSCSRSTCTTSGSGSLLCKCREVGTHDAGRKCKRDLLANSSSAMCRVGKLCNKKRQAQASAWIGSCFSQQKGSEAGKHGMEAISPPPISSGRGAGGGVPNSSFLAFFRTLQNGITREIRGSAPAKFYFFRGSG